LGHKALFFSQILQSRTQRFDATMAFCAVRYFCDIMTWSSFDKGEVVTYGKECAPDFGSNQKANTATPFNAIANQL